MSLEWLSSVRIFVCPHSLIKAPACRAGDVCFRAGGCLWRDGQELALGCGFSCGDSPPAGAAQSCGGSKLGTVRCFFHFFSGFVL